MTRLIEVIIPLPAPRPGLRGDFLGYTSPRVMATFLGRRLSSPSPFVLAEPLEMALGTNEDVPSYPLVFFASSFLRVAVALTLCLAASISVKDNKCALGKQTVRTKLTRMVENLLTMARVFVQFSSFRRQLRSPAV